MNNKISVLVVEDDEDLLDVIMTALEQNKINGQGTGKLTDAIFKLRNQRYDYILLDLNIIGGNSETLIEAIRSDKKQLNFETPIFVISGEVNKGFIRTYHKFISKVFVKPFQIFELIELLLSK